MGRKRRLSWPIFVAIFFLIILVFVSQRGEETESKGEDPVKIGYVINNLNDTFQNYILTAAEEEAEKYGYGLLVQNSQEDLIQQQDIVHAMIANDIDALIVVPVDTSAMEPITKAAQKAKVPLIYVNRNPFFEERELPEGVYYVGTDEVEAGRIQGQYLEEALPESSGVAILMGILGNQGTLQRTQGNTEVLQESKKDIQILAQETAEWQRDQALSITENWVSTYDDDLEAILANNDEMALGAVQASENTGTDPVIVGLDATPDALNAIKEGKMDATIFQDAKGQGRTAIDMVHQLVSGQEIKSSIVYTSIELITEENVDDYD